MNEQIQVSVAVATYNPNRQALRSTLDSIVCQRDVIQEIIITDDGSQQKDFSWLPSYFEAHNVRRYQILEHAENKGTVQNYLAAVTAATGEYIFCISPGDMLYDAHVLADFYRFAKQNNAGICFGNAVYYSNEGEELHCSKECRAPRNPDVYTKNAWLGKMSFLMCGWICGVSYFRRREQALIYFGQAAKHCKYIEDTSSTVYALAGGERLWYYDRNIAWYEHGIGISTSGSEKWNQMLRQEYKAAYLNAQKLYPHDSIIQVAAMKYSEMPRWKKRIRKIFKYPHVLIARRLFLSKKIQKKLSVTDEDIQRLKHFISGDTE